MPLHPEAPGSIRHVRLVEIVPVEHSVAGQVVGVVLFPITVGIEVGRARRVRDGTEDLVVRRIEGRRIWPVEDEDCRWQCVFIAVSGYWVPREEVVAANF